MQKQVALGVDILLHILMNVQVVGGYVGHHRHLGALAHGNELKGGKLHHRVVLRLHVHHLGQQRRADVPAHMDGMALGLEHLGDQGGGGGLSVRPGDSDELRRAQVEEDLHLRSDRHPICPVLGQLRQRVGHTGGAENYILIKIMEVILAQYQIYAKVLEYPAVFPQFLETAAVPSRDYRLMLLKELHKGHMAASYAAEGDTFASYALEKRCGVHL